jgi:AcrR family transcriptional regulator
MPAETDISPAPTTRDRILRAAAALLEREGRDALSTRAVGTAAGVQAPTLYRLFGDKAGLLQAVAAYGFESYLTQKHGLDESDDPVTDLRRGWDMHVQFGLSRPAFYMLMYADSAPCPAAREAEAVLLRMVSRVAAAGRLRYSVDRAARLIHGTAMGLVLALIATPEDDRDLELLTIARENVLREITVDGEQDSRAASEPGNAAARTRAVALRAALRAEPTAALSAAEQAVLGEWLDRIADEPR